MGLYVVVGDPITHSLSPVMHNAAFRHLGMNENHYDKICLGKESISILLDAINSGKISGANVTHPLKTIMMENVDVLTKSALDAHAVNTLSKKNDEIIGDSTDGRGCISALLSAGTVLKDKRVALIGAGGSARSIAYELFSEDIEKLSIVNRTVENSKLLAKGLSNAESFPLSSLSKVARNSDIIINATTIGMSGHAQHLPLSKQDILHRPVIMDIVYHPLKTPLIEMGEMSGCPIIQGIEMLLWQGALSFETWCGVVPPIDVMRNAIVKQLGLMQ